jgi:molybdate transport system permease protein
MLTRSLGLGGLPFTFAGLVVASVFYSLPFVVQPIQNAFMAMGAPAGGGRHPESLAVGSFVHVALPSPVQASLRRRCWALPIRWRIGVVLMIGGNIPTRPGCSPCRSTTTWKPWSTDRPTAWPPAAGGSFVVLLALYRGGSQHAGSRAMSGLCVACRLPLADFVLDTDLTLPGRA